MRQPLFGFGPEEPIVVEIWERHVSAETGQVLAMVRRRDLEAQPLVVG